MTNELQMLVYISNKRDSNKKLTKYEPQKTSHSGDKIYQPLIPIHTSKYCLAQIPVYSENTGTSYFYITFSGITIIIPMSSRRESFYTGFFIDKISLKNQ